MRLTERRHWPVVLLALPFFPLFVGCDKSTTPTASATRAQPAMAAGGQGDRINTSGTQIPFEDANVFFEFNATDNDLGLQLFLDAPGWKTVEVADPRGQGIVQITAEGNLAQLGITELRFESEEPSPDEVLALFPGGHYEFTGQTVDGGNLVGRAMLSHVLLAAPSFSPADGQTVDPNNTVVTWNAPGADRVEIIIENDELGLSLDVTVSGSTTSLNVPPQFLTPGTEYKIEILAIGRNGNRTIVESTFVTMSAAS